jgi:hypothetical protein
MSNIFFQDAVTASNLPSNATHAVYYADGTYANRSAVAARCPHAKLYGITVWGQTGPGIFACDSETGDMDVAQTVAWVAEQVRLGVQLICVYANLNRWLNEGLKAQLDHYGSRIKRWVADYNNVAQIQPWADAEQYSDPGPVDLNVALANFFGDTPPAPPTQPLHYDWFDVGPFPSIWGDLNERLVVEQYDGARKHPVIYAVYLLILRAKLHFLANRVATVAGAGTANPSWGVFHRGWRYQALIHRAQGERVA